MDNDGDMDILSASYLDDTIAWYENDGASDPSWTAADIATSADSAWSVFAADMDNDGDMDILSASYTDDTIAWYENDGASDPSWTAADIATSADGASKVFAADMDNDGDMDILSSSREDDTIAWYENTATFIFDPDWTSSDVATSVDGGGPLFAADMDNDGDIDIVATAFSTDTVAWYENNGASVPSWTASTIATSADGANGIFVADLDNDGDMDIVSSSYNDDAIAWYENDGASDPSWTASDIATSADQATSVFVADMDNDGDMDIISSSNHDDTIAWYENDGASDPSWSASNIATNADGARDVFAGDLDGDGDMDIVSASYYDDTIAWYENDGASDPSWSASNIATNQDGAESVHIADMDNDGDLDIIAGSRLGDKVIWCENGGESDPSWTVSTISTSADGLQDVFAADLDNDGDMDIVSASSVDTTIAWYENDGASDPSWSATDITTVGQPGGVFVADLDNDGDLDIISGHSGSTDKIVMHTTGIPEFSNILMPVISVLAIVGFNYRKRNI